MLKNFLIAVCLLIAYNTYAQETVQVKRKFVNGVTERFNVLANDHNVMSGLYQALDGKTAIASGMYKANRRIGVWHFYNRKGSLLQNFDYDKMALMHEADDDIPAGATYAFDASIADTTNVTRPIKIGGKVFGYLPYLKLFELPKEIKNDYYQLYQVALRLLVSPGGRLAEYKVVLSYNGYEQSYNFNLDLLDPYEKLFLPATLKGENVAATIIIPCRIDSGGKLKYLDATM